MRLDFLVIGPQRAGTTFIYEYFKKHPEVCVPKEVKETFFFDRNYKKGFDWYFWHFRHCKSSLKIGEVAPTYFDDPEVPDRVYSFSKDIKLVVTLRNPYERTWSLYLHQLRYGFVKGSFEVAIQQDPRIITSSLYSLHLSKWFSLFGKDRIFVSFFEDLREEPSSYMKNICDFIGVNYIKLNLKPANVRDMARNVTVAGVVNRIVLFLKGLRMYWLINLGKKMGLKKLFYSGGRIPEGPTEKDLEIMSSYFEKDIESLERMLGKEFKGWKRG